MTKQSELIAGTCQQLLFSPKGGVEGALLKVQGKVVQVSMQPEVGVSLAHAAGPGKRVRVLGLADNSPKTADGAHPVFLFESFSDPSGAAIEMPGDDPKHTTIKGVVAALHFARHGEPNGVVLEGGEFIHLRPRGMAQVGLGVGAQVTAVGEVRRTVLGTRMLEARQVNRMVLE